MPEKHKTPAVDSTQSEKWRELLKYVRTAQVNETRKLVKKHHNELKEVINTKGRKGNTLLHHAAREVGSELVECLVGELNADVNAANEDGVTPLHVASRTLAKDPDDYPEENFARNMEETHHGTIEFLIRKGADPNVRDSAGWSPILYAIRANNYRAVKQLIRNADINLSGVDGLTPLLYATKVMNLEVVNDLLFQNASMDKTDRNGNTVMHYACLAKTPEFLNLFCEKYEEKNGQQARTDLINRQNKMKESPLHWAAMKSDVSVVQACLYWGADIQADNEDGETALHMAALANDPEIIRALCAAGARIDHKNSDQQVPLHVALDHDKKEAVEALLECGTSVDEPYGNGLSPIMVAADLGHEEICKILMERKPNIEIVDNCKKTILHIVTENEYISLLKMFLLEYGGKSLIDRKDNRGNTCSHLAAKTGNILILEILRDFDADLKSPNNLGETPLFLAAKCGNHDACFWLSELAEDTVLSTDEDGNLPVHMAAKSGSEEALQFFCRKFKVGSKTNDFGRTPLFMAVEENHTECVEYLLKNVKVDVNVCDRTNITPLFLACLAGCEELVKLLMAHKADPTIRVELDHPKYANWNALDAAIESRSLECVEEILSSTFWKEAIQNEIVLNKMIRDMPDAAIYAVDRMVTYSNLPVTDPEFNVKFHFGLLENSDHRGTEEKVRVNLNLGTNGLGRMELTKLLRTKLRPKTKFVHPIQVMLQNDRYELLESDIVQALLAYKWIRLTIPYAINILLYILFLVFFTSFMLLSRPPYMLINETLPTLDAVCKEFLAKDLKTGPDLLVIPKYGLWILAVLNILKEFGQLIQARLDYFNLENLIEVSIYALAIATSIDLNKCQFKTLLREHWQWQTGVVGLTFSWINLLLFIQQNSDIGIYVGMFLKILRSLGMLFLVFSPFLVAFALAFFLLLRNQVGFQYPLDSLARTFAMIGGEVEFTDTVFSRYEADAGFEKAVAYVHLTNLIYLLFIGLMVMVLMNLVTGIAVGDVSEIQLQVSFERLRTKVERFFGAQKILTAFRIKWDVPKTYVINVNGRKSCLDRLFLSMFSIDYILTEAEHNEDNLGASNRPPTAAEFKKVKEKVDEAKEEINELKDDFESNDEMHSSIEEVKREIEETGKDDDAVEDEKPPKDDEAD